MSGQEIETEKLMSLFEAARWAPSSFNNQPWRFLYSRRGSPSWDTFFNLLAPTNKTWAKNAAALILIASKRTFDRDGKPSRTHSFDTGAAWASLALQGSRMGLVVHGMQGFDYDKAQEALKLPTDSTVEAMIAVGLPGRKEDLPEPLREKEFPNDRKPLTETVFEGFFPADKA